MPISLHLVEKTENPAKGKKRPPPPSPKEKEAFLAEAKGESAPPTPIGKNHKILIVDDNPDGFIVTTTTNGAAVASTAEQAQAELIILDVNFPAGGAMEWSGFTVMQWLTRFPELARLPVILISGSEASEYKTKAMAAGAVAFFQKPVVYKEILQVMLKTLGETK